uniref:Uncharacterized protein n=1 Tax=Zooxanthella nutricula TaxID=1333877 RepID=A0A6U9WME5_9DINO|mmetsp:Transcript_2110/g.6272  ORF Transcript_2110/g.6272 Transcript_2110/m.6272 type:complete len:143 (+) Transcript_2110:2-430(+)
MRLTTDMALVSDENFKQIVTEFEQNQDALDNAFAQAWFQLMTNGGKWAKNQRCTTPEATELFSRVKAGEPASMVAPHQPLGNGPFVGIAIASGVVTGALVAGGVLAARRTRPRRKKDSLTSSSDSDQEYQDGMQPGSSDERC